MSWETSTIRDWLNNEFADVAFSCDDRKKIAGAKISNEPNLQYGTPGGNTTKDRVFLLSESEATMYSDWISQDVRPTPYAENQGANNCWLLRSPGQRATHVAYISADGSINSAGTKACLLARAIRPLIYIKTSATCDLKKDRN